MGRVAYGDIVPPMPTMELVARTQRRPRSGALHPLLFTLVCALFALSAAGNALAQEASDADARRHFRLAQAHYENGDFAEAAEEFEAAYELSRRPALLYNLYLAHRDALNTVAARDALRLYLELVPDTADREALESRLAQMDRVIEEQEPTGEEDSSESGEAPAAGPVPTQGDSDSSPEAELAEAPSPEVADSSPPTLLPWLVLAGGGAVLATGAVLQGLSRKQFNELESICIDDLCPPDSDWQSIRDKGERLALAGDILFFTGLAGVAAGVALHFLLPREDDSEPADGASATATVACDGTGCMAAVVGRF